MQHGMMPALAAWESFYVIVGSSGAALTGLQFIVITLIAEAGIKSTSTTIHAFATPTIVHFCAVLFISAVLSAPWPDLFHCALLLGAVGALGVGYTWIVRRRARRQPDYRMVLEDWIWHASLPFVSYATLLGAAIFLTRTTQYSLFAIAGVAVLLLFIGIHNSWDSVAYVAVERMGSSTEAPPHPPQKPLPPKQRHRRGHR